MPQDVKAFNNDDMVMLTPDGKKAIDACIMRSKSAWSIIKEIAITKYNEYLTALEATCNTKNRQTELDSIVKRWKTDGSNQEFLNSKEFDSDLSYVLKAVAQRLHGLSTEFMNLEPYIRNWHTNRSIDRRTAFIISIGFGFNIEETRKLLYNVLDDDEQMDFNPRLPNEMIYAYAIIRGIPLTAKSEKESVSTLLHEAQTRFLKNLFGNKYSGYFDDLIHVADDSFNLLDSLNMTRSGFSLAIVKYVKDKEIPSENVSLILKALIEENVFSTTGIAELLSIIAKKNKFEKIEIFRILATLVSDNLVTRSKYKNIYAILIKNDILSKLDVEQLLEVFNNKQAGRQGNTNKKKNCRMIPSISIAQKLYEKVFFDESLVPYCEPRLDKAKKSKESYLLMIESAERYLKASMSKGKSLDNTICKSVLEFVQAAKKQVSKMEYGTMLSPIDLLPLLKNSKFCDPDYFSSELKSFLLEKYLKEATPKEKNRELDSNSPNSAMNDDETEFDIQESKSRASIYHPTSFTQLITKDQGEYFVFVWESILDSAKYLHLLSKKAIRFFWPVYVSMEEILTFPFLNEAGLAYRYLKEYEKNEARNINNQKRSDKDNRLDTDQDTLTVEHLENLEEAVQYVKNGMDFVSLVLNSLHSYEYFNSLVLSRGKEKFILQLMENGNIIQNQSQPDPRFLFLRNDAGMCVQEDLADSIWQFYRSKGYMKKYNAFKKMDDKETKKYKGNTVLLLAFYNWISEHKNYQQSPESRKAKFRDYFEKDVATIFNCKTINTKSVLYNFLISCLEEEDPLSFIQKKALSERKYLSYYSYKLFRKQFYENALPFKRNDILKLAFWDWISKPSHLAKEPDLRVVDFMVYYDRYVAPETCCSMINTNNSLDQILLLCLEQESPIPFLKATIVYLEELKTQNQNRRIIF